MNEKSPVLKFAQIISDRANAAWEDGSFLEQVTPTTRELLNFWFSNVYAEMRPLNFHEGQRQAILNTIYVHEILKKNSILEVYEKIAPQCLLEPGLEQLSSLGKQKYAHPKYAVKMATGTGKTWVAEALLIWQYLNAKHQEEGNYTKNFLIVAPGIIVYERWLDALLGKPNDDGITRDFETADIRKNEALFVPENFRDEIYGFLQSSVAAKNEIGAKTTGDGLIAVTNYHLLMNDKEGKNNGGWKLPVSPGVAAGNSLDSLDSSLDGKKELEFLRQLDDLMVINDEAHHIHSIKKGGEITEVEWQKSLSYIAEPKGKSNIQLDFSATPYNQRGKEKIFFPHIIVNFELTSAIQQGLVKTIILDERKEINTEDLDYSAIRDEKGKVIDLSDGQRTMLRAGIRKLQNLEDEFKKINKEKVPKLLVMCEDTNVVPLVAKFLLEEGLEKDDILEIHSNKKGEVGQDEWDNIKQKLSALDKHAQPRIVISVLMLREGFDVNNVCVIVPLRSTQSQILLEQTIGRGLRLMWRGYPEIDELKALNRQLVMVEKKKADNYFDVLSIIEHPAFRDFYKEFIKDGLISEETDGPEAPTKPKGDLIVSLLKDNYRKYDFSLPLILSQSEEVMKTPAIDPLALQPFSIPLNSLQTMVPKNEQWISTEITQNTHFGDYDVVRGVFRATSYNDYLMRIVNRIVEKLNTKTEHISKHRRGATDFPALSLNNAQIAGLIDQYIRHRLFKQTIDPNKDDIWHVLLISDVINHIVGQIAGQIVKAQEETESRGETEVRMIPLSSVEKITVRENYALDLVKTIYDKTPYPSNKGKFERDFMIYADNDGAVDALCKIIETRHTFVRFRYVREDGIPAEYIPDFFVRFGDEIYIVETKAQNQISDANVQRKKKAILRWVEKVNELPANKRDHKNWHYCILGDSTFYEWQNKHMTMREVLNYTELKNNLAHDSGKLF